MAQLEGAPEALRAKTERMLDAGNYLAEHFAETPVVLVFCFNPKLMAITDREAGPRLGGRRRVDLPRGRERAARVPRRGARLRADDAAVRGGARGARAARDPGAWATAAAVPIGYPLRRGHGPISRRPVAKLAFADRWDVPWGSRVAACTSPTSPSTSRSLRDTLRRFVAAEMPPERVRQLGPRAPLPARAVREARGARRVRAHDRRGLRRAGARPGRRGRGDRGAVPRRRVRRGAVHPLRVLRRHQHLGERLGGAEARAAAEARAGRAAVRLRALRARRRRRPRERRHARAAQRRRPRARARRLQALVHGRGLGRLHLLPGAHRRRRAALPEPLVRAGAARHARA